MKPVIAIDFDDTLTASPDAWKVAICAFLAAGHSVVCITQRRDTDENIEEIGSWMSAHDMGFIPIYFCSLASKTKKLESLGIKNYILCDNDPESAVRGI